MVSLAVFINFYLPLYNLRFINCVLNEDDDEEIVTHCTANSPSDVSPVTLQLHVLSTTLSVTQRYGLKKIE